MYCLIICFMGCKDPCENTICKNNGICESGDCICTGGYTGANCEAFDLTIEWKKSYGGANVDFITSIQQTTDGGYIIVGESDSNDGDVEENKGGYDYWILKLDQAGDESIDGDVRENNGGADFWILKLDNIGNLEWKNTYGGTKDEVATSIQQTTDDGYIVAGTSTSNDGDVGRNNGTEDYWILKLNIAGDIEWENSYGGTKWDRIGSVQQTIDGGYIVAGESESNDGDVEGNKGDWDYWILKLAKTGDLEWKKSYGGSNSDKANFIQQTLDGGYIIAGSSRSNDGDVGGNNGYADYWILKLDMIGNIEWENNYGGTEAEEAYSVQQTKEGGYIVAGQTYSNNGDVGRNNGEYDSWILKIDKLGSIEWENSYGGSNCDQAKSIQQTIDGGFIIGGYSESNNGDLERNYGSRDYWVIKLSKL